MEEQKKIEEAPKKAKRVLSEKQKEALARGRAKAHERLREFRKNKGSIEKSDEPVKEEEPKKEAPKQRKRITKEDVNYGDSDEREEFAQIHNKVMEEEEEEEKLQLKPQIVKKSKPKKKQVVIVEESSDSSSSEEEQVIVRRSRRKNKVSQPTQQQETHQVSTNIPKQPTLLFY